MQDININKLLHDNIYNEAFPEKPDSQSLIDNLPNIDPVVDKDLNNSNDEDNQNLKDNPDTIVDPVLDPSGGLVLASIESTQRVTVRAEDIQNFTNKVIQLVKTPYRTDKGYLSFQEITDALNIDHLQLQEGKTIEVIPPVSETPYTQSFTPDLNPETLDKPYVGFKEVNVTVKPLTELTIDSLSPANVSQDNPYEVTLASAGKDETLFCGFKSLTIKDIALSSNNHFVIEPGDLSDYQNTVNFDLTEDINYFGAKNVSITVPLSESQSLILTPQNNKQLIIPTDLQESIPVKGVPGKDAVPPVGFKSLRIEAQLQEPPTAEEIKVMLKTGNEITLLPESDSLGFTSINLPAVAAADFNNDLSPFIFNAETLQTILATKKGAAVEKYKETVYKGLTNNIEVVSYARDTVIQPKFVPANLGYAEFSTEKFTFQPKVINEITTKIQNIPYLDIDNSNKTVDPTESINLSNDKFFEAFANNYSYDPEKDTLTNSNYTKEHYPILNIKANGDIDFYNRYYEIINGKEVSHRDELVNESTWHAKGTKVKAITDIKLQLPTPREFAFPAGQIKNLIKNKTCDKILITHKDVYFAKTQNGQLSYKPNFWIPPSPGLLRAVEIELPKPYTATIESNTWIKSLKNKISSAKISDTNEALEINSFLPTADGYEDYPLDDITLEINKNNIRNVDISANTIKNVMSSNSSETSVVIDPSSGINVYNKNGAVVKNIATFADNELPNKVSIGLPSANNFAVAGSAEQMVIMIEKNGYFNNLDVSVTGAKSYFKLVSASDYDIYLANISKCSNVVVTATHVQSGDKMAFYKMIEMKQMQYNSSKKKLEEKANAAEYLYFNDKLVYELSSGMVGSPSKELPSNYFFGSDPKIIAIKCYNP
jgi:hypothetical protein